MQIKLLLFFIALLAIPLALAGSCGNGFCEDNLNETTVTCCEDCGCTGNKTCYGDVAFPEQKTCVDPFCGDEFCDDTLDWNSIPEEYWKNCCDDCGCQGSDKWESEKMEGQDIPFYQPTDDLCYYNHCHGCSMALHCSDGNNCTVDECLHNSYLNKSICFNVPITACRDRDGCCPSNCSYNDDTDCKGSCGNRKCELSEDCKTCPIDCGCEFGFDCVNGKCTQGGNYCEMRGQVRDGQFCDGSRWRSQFETGAACEQSYECSSKSCKESACVANGVSAEQRAYYTKVGLIAVVIAIVTAYLIIVFIRFSQREKKFGEQLT